MRLLTAIWFVLFCLPAEAQFSGLLVNEFSQGDQGSREYIELLVAGRRTCTDSTADLRGWIVDDQNGWYGTTSITSGHYRFKNIAAWSAVPIGSIILLYNSASGQKNLSISLPDDPTDANGDGAYILPINASAYLEEHDNEPSPASTPAYVYPPAASTAGYNGTSNTWNFHVALTNGSDAISTVSPQDRSKAFFSIAYGLASSPPFQLPTVSVAAVNGGFNCFLTNSNGNAPGSWSIAAVPLLETPGLPNGGANSTWIQTMRTTPKALHTYATVCSNGPYNFFGQTITTTGAYTVLSATATGCVDTNDAYIVVRMSDTKDTAGCDSVRYKGTVYRSNTTIVDRITSVVILCDSLVRTVRITVKKSSASATNICLASGQNYSFNGQTYSASGHYTATLQNTQGCDSVAHLYLVKTRRDTVLVTGCGSVTYNGQLYSASTLRNDTLKSRLMLCDSIIRTANIVVNQPVTVSLNGCAEEGQPYVFNGTTLTTTGHYSFTYRTVAGCDSVVKLYVVFRKIVADTVKGCDSIFYRNRWYFANLAFRDTVRSSISGCDSVVLNTLLLISNSKRTAVVSCLLAGGSYVFNGQLLTASGTYVQSLQTLAGCDSVVRLQLTVATRRVQIHSGCDSVRYNGQEFYTSFSFSDTLRNQAGCDSLIIVDSIVVNRSKQTATTVCLPPGGTYVFNGQTLSTSGSYSATFTTGICDSTVQLQLVVATRQTLNLQHCKAVVYNGSLYTASAAFTDTLKSFFGGCDSVYRTVNIVIQPLPKTVATQCLPPGGSYVFNGQTLNTTGHYTTTFTTAGGCDSTVQLYLLVARQETQMVEGCEFVVYRGIRYNSSTIVSDTVRSLLSACDSIINTTNIIVHTRPLLTVSGDTNICLGDSAVLIASTTNAVVTWAGNVPGDTLTISPTVTTTYRVTAIDTNGCRATAAVRVFVESFSLQLSAQPVDLLPGSAATIFSSGNTGYTVLSWQPATVFPNQTALVQRLYVDSSLAVTAVAQTALGCRDTASLLLTILPLDDVYIPSAFTPNGDGKNDELRVVGSNIAEIDFRVFNRWGAIVFATRERGKAWDGRSNGAMQPAGVYVYVARIKKRNGQAVEKKGTVVLIR